MYHVLIVDDEPIIRNGIKNFINWEELDCSVVGCSPNGYEALQVFENENVDILITDIRMPDISGLELIERGAKINSHTKSIILSGYPDFHYAQTAMQLGCTAFILKDDPLPRIKEEVKKIITLFDKEKLQKATLEKLQDRLIQNNNELKNKFIFDLICGTILSKQEKEEKALQYLERLGSFCLVLLQLTLSRTKYDTEENIKPFLSSIMNALKLAFQDSVYSIFSMNENTICILLNNNTLSFEDIHKQCASVGEIAIQMTSRIKMKWGISAFYSGSCENILTAYAQADMALEQRFIPTLAKDAGLSDNSESIISKALAYIDMHFKEEITLASLSHEVGLNPSYFSRYFKKKTGYSFVQYLNAYRIEKAKKYLRNTDYKLNYICEKTGFHDVAYFSNTFKKMTGLSPSEYKYKY